MREETFKPSPGSRSSQAAADARMGDPLKVLPDSDKPGGYVFVDGAGRTIGAVTARHWVARGLTAGQRLLHASINCVTIGESGASITVRVVIGGQSDRYEIPTVPPRQYKASVVGESFYQANIVACRWGDPVTLVHITDNEHDPRAVAVLNAQRLQIGFLPRDGWLTAALLDQDKKYKAWIDEVHAPSGSRKFTAVVLKVEIH